MHSYQSRTFQPYKAHGRKCQAEDVTFMSLVDRRTEDGKLQRVPGGITCLARKNSTIFSKALELLLCDPTVRIALTGNGEHSGKNRFQKLDIYAECFYDIYTGTKDCIPETDDPMFATWNGAKGIRGQKPSKI